MNDLHNKSNWMRVSLKDVCSSITDCVNKTAPVTETRTPFKMLRTTNIRNGWIDTDNTNRVTSEVYGKWTRRQKPQIGDVILTREAPLGEVGIIRHDDSIFLGQRLVSYRANPTELDSKFLLYSFLSHDLQSQIKALGMGAIVPHMRVPDAEKLTILIPDLSVQNEISSIISAYDDLIENNQWRIKILEEMAQRLYAEWFVHYRFPGHEQVKMVESGTDYGMIPDEWLVMRLADAVLVNPPTKILDRNNVLHVSMESLSTTLSTVDTTKSIRNSTVSGSKFQNKDVLFARITPCLENGKTGFVNFLKDTESACGSTEFIVFREKILTPTFIYLLSRSYSFRESAKLTMVGASGRQRVQSAFFNEFEVLVPSSDILVRFEDLVKNNFEEISVLFSNTLLLKEIRDKLITKLIG